jgi:cysteine desulfurase / selenocysteine lyase
MASVTVPVGHPERSEGSSASRQNALYLQAEDPSPAARDDDFGTRVRGEFPILEIRVHDTGPRLVYLDNAATTQKPQAVIDATSRYYAAENANIHRGVHWLSEQATIAYDAVRERARAFLGAEHSREVIFTRGTTDGINLVAASFGEAFVRPGEEVLVTEMEHHSNIVPWQLMAERRGVTVRAVPMTDRGQLDLDALGSLLGPRTRLLAVTHLSNALGTVNPVREIAELAHARGVPVLVDGAQSAPRMPVDVQALDCDFFVCSGHKMYGPTGIGLLYGRAEWLERMPPYQGGGDMIETVGIEHSTYAPLPNKFEAGTPNIAGVVGLGEALDWIESVGREHIEAHEAALLSYALERLPEVDGLSIVGAPVERAGVVSFVMDGVHPHDIGTILDASHGVAIRVGHHCAQPLMRRLGLVATARASFAAYNTRDDVDRLIDGLREVRRLFPAA